MKLLAVGGPRHGQELPYNEGQTVLYVPVPPGLYETDQSITTAMYERRVVSDRDVWVYVG